MRLIKIYRKSFLTIIVLILLPSVMFSQNASLEWVNSFGSTSYDYGNAITTDNNGNVYTTGYFSGTVDFNPGSPITNLTAVGGKDVFIQKLDSNGGLVWVKQVGGSADEVGNSIVSGANGNVFIIGDFAGTCDFDPSTNTSNLTSSGADDIFILKLDANGSFLWVKKIGGVSTSFGSSICLDISGNVYATGLFIGTFDFNPGSGVYNLISNSSADIFVLKLNSTGSFVWAKQMGSSSTGNVGRSITTDNLGNVYTTGSFSFITDFDPGSGTFNLFSSGQKDIFIQKLTSAGSFVWANRIGGSGNESGFSISTDMNNNVYSTGSFSGSVDFDPGGLTYYITAGGSTDIYVQKMNSQGAFLWAKGMGSTGIDVGKSINTDNSGNVYVTGGFSDTVDFNPGTGVFNVISKGNVDIFIQKLSANGNFIWAKGMGWQYSSDYGRGISIDNNDNVFTTGTFWGTGDFDPGSGVSNLTSNGYTDIFIQKLHYCSIDSTIFTVATCDNYTWINGVTYTASNFSAKDTLINALGCDSIIFLNLTIYNNTSIEVVNACSIYTWVDGVTYTSSNYSATDTLTNANGCDSVITLNLTMRNEFRIDTVIGCGSYTWVNGVTYTAANNSDRDTLMNVYGCDSIIQLNLTFGQSNTGIDVISACESYTWINGVTYTAMNNTAMDTLINASGCDSVVTLNLTILRGDTSIDVVTACDSYVWINGLTYTYTNNTATHLMSNLNGCDSLIYLDLTIDSSNSSIVFVNECYSYTWINGVTYTSSSNSISDTLTSINGCDSIIFLVLTINTNTYTDVIVACDSVTWMNGVTYYSSTNSVTDTLVNLNGCDTIVTLDLVINNATTSVDFITACDSFTWINGVTYTSSNATDSYTLANALGCDSVVTLDLTIIPSSSSSDVISVCDSYTWINGITYTESNNIATQMLVNSVGCDSLVTLDLTINSVSNIMISFTDSTITANNANATYQWINCNTNTILSNEINQVYVATENGNYAVELTENGCVDTSDCVSITAVSIIGINNPEIKIYPNPNNGAFILDLGKKVAEEVVIYDINGRIITSIKKVNKESFNLEVAPGIYLMKIQIENKVYEVRLIIE